MMLNQNDNLPAKQGFRTSIKELIVRRIVFSISAIISILLGSIGIADVVHLCTGKLPVDYLVSAIAALLFSFFFSFIALHQYRLICTLTEFERECTILAFAKRQGGVVSLPAVALNCSLRIADAVNVLNSLTSRGVCILDVSENGDLLYCFPLLKDLPSS